MRSNYKRIGDYVNKINHKNKGVFISNLQGVNINKYFMPSVANIIGTDLSKYKIVKKNQFVFNPMHVGRDEAVPISMYENDDPIIVSPAFEVFEVKQEKLIPAYLMMWCSRSEFDRLAWFVTDNSVRGGFSWDEFCNIKLPIPSIEKQKEICSEYNIINDRVSLTRQFTQKLDDITKLIYKKWFIEFEFPISKEHAEFINKPFLKGEPYKSSGGAMKYCKELEREIPVTWNFSLLNDLVESFEGGGWGEDSYQDNFKCEVKCIRGTDIPKARLGSLSSAPVRYILEKNLEDKSLNQGDIVIEISGGSPTQSTGRPLLINEHILNDNENDLICSNFCKTLRIRDLSHSEYFYYHLIYLYNQGKMFLYENSTTGVKNFDIESFLLTEGIAMPDKYLINEFIQFISIISENIFLCNKDMEHLLRNKNFFTSTLIFRERIC